MIPLRDTTPSKNYPYVNHGIIGVNILLYLVELGQKDIEHFIYLYGLVPARYSIPEISSYFSLWDQTIPFISFMFLHGGFWHLIGNIWFLYIFGDNIEDHFGPIRYFVFYILCGLSSGIIHMIFNLKSNIPTIGASGAIAGVMGAYFILHPGSKILTLIPIIIFPYFVELPAFFFLGVWFIIQFLNAAISHGQVTGIAWWAHIGGFVCGIIFLKLFHQMPHTGITERLQPLTTKRKTHHLQIIHPSMLDDDPHLYGTIHISNLEAITGTTKLINVPWGFYDRIFKVVVPPGITDGQLLRLKGLGKRLPNGERGDMMLRVSVE